MRQFLIIIACLLVSLLRSQEVIIQPPIFSEFECTEFYQLYTGSIMNFSTETYQANMILEVDYTSPAGISNSIADGILTGGSNLSINPGTTPINNGTYETFYSNRQITFYDTGFESQIATTKCLPPGTYEVCLTLVDPAQVDNPTNIISQTCYVREKQMLTQLLLVSPFENDETIVDMPLFTWTPVTPINPGAMYRIQMVEVLANQTPFEAFRSNPIFFEQSGLMSNIFQYPVSARTMLPCTRYAWRVTYELRGSFVSSAFQKSPDFLQESEIWEFSRPCDEEEVEEDIEEPFSIYDKFHVIDNYDPSSIVTVVDYKLRLMIDNTYSSMEPFSYLIIDSQGNENEYDCCWLCCYETEDMDDETTRYNSPAGENFIDIGIQKLIIDLDELGLDPKKTYTLRVKSGKSKKDIKFKINL